MPAKIETFESTARREVCVCINARHRVVFPYEGEDERAEALELAQAYVDGRALVETITRVSEGPQGWQQLGDVAARVIDGILPLQPDGGGDARRED